MFARTKLGLASIATTVVALAVVSGPAQARDHTAFNFNGTTGTSLSPAIPAPPNGQGQTGTYTFTGNVPDPTSATPSCVYQDFSTTPPVVTNPCSGTISSSGTYTNQQCGTGTATGTATISGFTPAVEGPFTTSYTIVFAAGRGTLTVTGGSDADGDTGATGGGTVILTNFTGENCVTTGATGFTVNGTVSATLG
jgi:hypothetical protein